MFHVTSIGQNNNYPRAYMAHGTQPQIDWHTGDIAMMRCPASCKLKSTEERDWMSCILADKNPEQPDVAFH